MYPLVVSKQLIERILDSVPGHYLKIATQIADPASAISATLLNSFTKAALLMRAIYPLKSCTVNPILFLRGISYTVLFKNSLESLSVNLT